MKTLKVNADILFRILDDNISINDLLIKIEVELNKLAPIKFSSPNEITIYTRFHIKKIITK